MQACCLLESFTTTSALDPVDQLARYKRWYTGGHWSPLGTCFDIGNTTVRACVVVGGTSDDRSHNH